MTNADMASRLQALKFETDAVLADIGSKLDELAACPPGHDRAGQLKQQVASQVDKVRSAIADVQPAPDDTEPVEDRPAPQLAASGDATKVSSNVSEPEAAHSQAADGRGHDDGHDHDDS